MRSRSSIATLTSTLIGLAAFAGQVGLAAAGPIGAMPMSFTFPDTGTGTQSADQTVTLTNNSNMQANVTNLSFSGDGARQVRR